MKSGDQGLLGLGEGKVSLFCCTLHDDRLTPLGKENNIKEGEREGVF